MKLVIASDIHGSAYYCNLLVEQYKKEKADRLLLLGDLLYHGPRNDLPKDYHPKTVIEVLNGLKEEIICVRGNCEAEVDQMVLEFPVLSESLLLFLDNRVVYATHGHIYHKGNLPSIKKGDILLHGHTHVQAMEWYNDILYLNPGSVSIPKENNENSYMVYEDGIYTIKNLEGKTISSIAV